MTVTSRSLSGVSLFNDLNDDARASIEARCTWRDYNVHDQIIDYNDDSQDVFFITRGTARVVNFSMSGREISFDDLKEGTVFGEMAAVDGAPRSASVVAITPATVGVMHPMTFRTVLEEHPAVAMALMTRLVQMVRMSVERIMDLSTLGANNRVYAELLRLAKNAMDEDGSARVYPIPIHADLASRVSTTRETVARVMSDLARKGLVRRDGNALILTDTVQLREMVEQFRGA